MDVAAPYSAHGCSLFCDDQRVATFPTKEEATSSAATLNEVYRLGYKTGFADAIDLASKEILKVMQR